MISADPETWRWVFSTVIQAYGALLGLMAIFLIYAIRGRYLPKKEGHIRGGWIALIFMSVCLAISILFLAAGEKVNYDSFYFWSVGVIYPIITLIIVVWVIGSIIVS